MTGCVRRSRAGTCRRSLSCSGRGDRSPSEANPFSSTATSSRSTRGTTAPAGSTCTTGGCSFSLGAAGCNGCCRCSTTKTTPTASSSFAAFAEAFRRAARRVPPRPGVGDARVQPTTRARSRQPELPRLTRAGSPERGGRGRCAQITRHGLRRGQGVEDRLLGGIGGGGEDRVHRPWGSISRSWLTCSTRRGASCRLQRRGRGRRSRCARTRPTRASPTVARLASRRHCTASSGASVARITMIEPWSGVGERGVLRTDRPSKRQSVDPQRLPVAVVGLDQGPDGEAPRRRVHHPGGGADAPLEVVADHPGPTADIALRHRARGRRVKGCPCIAPL